MTRLACQTAEFDTYNPWLNAPTGVDGDGAGDGEGVDGVVVEGGFVVLGLGLGVDGVVEDVLGLRIKYKMVAAATPTTPNSTRRAA
jgi:hypothetical protein